MNMKKYIDRCNEMIKQAKKTGNKTQVEKLKIINKILQQDKPFLYMTMDTAFKIFNDLGYSKEEAKAEYIQATSYKSY